MSRNTKNVTKKPYCKVCHDAGKPESEYTSHWVKDLTGKTTCPTLLNTECRYCYKRGHTAKFCDVLAKNNKGKERAEHSTQVVKSRKQPAPAVQKKPQNTGALGANVFQALCEDNEPEEKVSNTINEYPVLCEPAKDEVRQPEVKTGWAAIAAKPKEDQGERGFANPVSTPGFVVLSDYNKKEAETKPVVEAKIAPMTAQPKTRPMKSWADWSDSEDDDDDEIPPQPVLRRGRHLIGYNIPLNMPNNIEDFLSDDEEMPKFPPVLRRENAVWSASNNYTWH